MKRLVLAAMLLLSALAPAWADYRYVGPWFVTATLNTANGQTSLVTGQNSETLGINFTCFDRRVSMGIWQPGRSLMLPVAARTAVELRINALDPIRLVGIATAPNLAEYDVNIGLVVREMLAGGQADVLFTDHAGRNIHEIFRLDNAVRAFADIGRACPL